MEITHPEINPHKDNKDKKQLTLLAANDNKSLHEIHNREYFRYGVRLGIDVMRIDEAHTFKEVIGQVAKNSVVRFQDGTRIKLN